MGTAGMVGGWHVSPWGITLLSKPWGKANSTLTCHRVSQPSLMDTLLCHQRSQPRLLLPGQRAPGSGVCAPAGFSPSKATSRVLHHDSSQREPNLPALAHLSPDSTVIVPVQPSLPAAGPTSETANDAFSGRAVGRCSRQPGAGRRLRKQGLAVPVPSFSKVQVPSLWDNRDTWQKSSGKHIQPVLLHPACSVAFSALFTSPPRGHASPQSHLAVPPRMQMLWDLVL